MGVNIVGGSNSGGQLDFYADIDLTLYNRKAAELVKVYEQATGKIVGSAQKQSAALEGLAKQTSIAVASYLSLNAAKGFITDIVKVRGEFQQLEVSFNTMLKSKE